MLRILKIIHVKNSISDEAILVNKFKNLKFQQQITVYKWKVLLYVETTF